MERYQDSKQQRRSDGDDFQTSRTGQNAKHSRYCGGSDHRGTDLKPDGMGR
jgi:hypothetical protein